jgi:hypothetical protein
MVKEDVRRAGTEKIESEIENLKTRLRPAQRTADAAGPDQKE